MMSSNNNPGDPESSKATLSSRASSYRASLLLPISSSNAKGESSKSTKLPTNVKEIEKLVGFINEQYECVHNNFAGTLYAGPLAVVWLGRIFFFEWTVVIKWEEVVQVQKRNDGVCFILQSKATHDFVKLFNVERAWASLVSLHNDTILDKPRREPTPRQVTRSLRRMNSDPMRMSFVFEESEEEQQSPSTWIKGSSRAPRRETISRSVTAPLENKLDRVKESVSQESLQLEPSSKVSLEQQWSSVVEQSYAVTAVDKLELPCSLDSFWNMFLSDDAKYSIPTFMKESGDEEIQCSPWKMDEDGVTLSRTIEYTHPVSAPMAPPMARARKEQRFKKFGNNGMVLETKTYVADVPMTDCFFVADQILVEPVNDTTVTVTMSFDLEFVKSTMFKAIIVRTTKGEFQSFMQRLGNFKSKSLGQAAIAAPVLVPPPIPEKEPTPKLVDMFVPKITLGVLSLVLVLQIWILVDLASVKATLRQLPNQRASCPA